MEKLLAWLTALPLAAVYAVLALIAAVENIFPPVPADTVVAFGSFLAARGKGSPYLAYAFTLVGNLVGAAIMYGAGRRFGADWLRAKFLRDDTGEKEARFRRMYDRYGLPALFLSRFLPGVRALVPPLAGAFHVPPVGALAAMGLASALWYGMITIVAYRLGSNWDAVQATIGRYGKIVGAVAAAAAVAVLLVWLVRRRRRA